MEAEGGLFWSLGLVSVKALLEGKVGVALLVCVCVCVCVCPVRLPGRRGKRKKG